MNYKPKESTNMYSKPTITAKPSAPVSAMPISNAAAPGDKPKAVPNKILKQKQGEAYENLTGLFEKTAKNGNTFYAGRLRDETGILLFMNDDKTATLHVGEAKVQLKSATSKKDGSSFWAGSDYFVFDHKPKSDNKSSAGSYQRR